MKLLLPIHSFVDLITNSSSEIYIQANKNTITAIKGVIDAILATGGSISKADDFFEFDLVVKIDNPKPLKERKPGEGCIVDASIDSTEGKAYLYECEGEYDNPAQIYLSVKAKPSNLAEAAKVLSNLTGLFSIDSRYNG